MDFKSLFLFEKSRINSKFIVSAIFVFLSLLMIASAAHVITTSSGTTSFNFNEDVSNLYNISVNITDLGQNANVTQVNITLPNGFAFLTGSENTTANNYSFVNTSSVLSWTNSSFFLLNGTGGSVLTFFRFNATMAAPGNYNITVTTINGTGAFSSNISVIINDTTPPTVTSFIITFNDGNVTSANTVFMSPKNYDGKRDGIKVNITASEQVNFSIDIINGSGSVISSPWTDNNANDTIKPSACFWNATSTQCAGGTNLSDGYYTFNVSMTDMAGNKASNTSKTIVVDNTAPIITDNSNLTAGTYYNGTKLINITIIDFLSSVNVTLHVNGSVVNTSVYVNNNTQLTFLLAEGNHTYSVNATDFVYNTNATANVSSVVVDTTNPGINFTSPTPSTGVNLSQNSLYINISLTELNLANVTYSLYNSSGIVNRTVFSNANTTINFTNLASDNYTYQVNITDLANNKNATELRTIRLDIIAPNATLLFPLNNTFNSTTSQNFTVNITDNLGIKNATLFIYNGTGLVNQTTISFGGGLVQTVGIVVTLIDNAYKWFYTIFDWAGNSFTVQNNTLTIDTIRPNLTIIYPTNISYNTTQTAINYTVADTNLQACWYSTNNGATNTTVTCGTNVTGLNSGEGSVTWRVFANDSAGNRNDSSITFFVDSIKPTIQFASPTDTNNSFVPRNNIPINVTANDTNLVNISLSLFNSSFGLINWSNSSTSPLFMNFTGLSDGIYYFNASARDILNNTNNTETRRVTLDTINPQLNYTSPTQTDGATVSANFIFVNVSVNETNEANITFRLFNSSTLINVTTFSTAVRTINFTNLIVGNYSYNVTSIDLANNQNHSATRNISLIDIVAPNGNLLTPANGTYANAPQNYTANATDNLGIKNATVFLYNNSGALINQSTINFGGGVVQSTVGLVVSIVDGVYNWFYRIFDWGGNSFTTGNNTITIDTIAPNVQYAAPTESDAAYYNRTNIQINVTASDLYLTNITIRLYNTTGLVIQSTTTTTANFVNATNLPDGVYTFNASATDLGNNINWTARRTVTVDTIPPSVSFVSPQSTTYYNLSVLINISSNGNTVTFYNGTGVETYTGAVYRNFTEGSNTINATAVDLAGNSNRTNVTFSVIYPPVVTLNSPVDGLANPSNSITVNCSATDNLEVKNISLFVNGVLNKTQAGTGSNKLELTTGLSLPDGTYTWSCNSFDNMSTSSTSSTRTFTIDTVNPQVKINSPTLNAKFNTFNFAVNITLNEPGYCDYNVDNGANITLSNVSSTMYIGTSNAQLNGFHSFKAFCRDLAGNKNHTESVSSFIIEGPSSSGGSGGSGTGGGGGSGGVGSNGADIGIKPNFEGETIGQKITIESSRLSSGFTSILQEGDMFILNLAGQQHTIKLMKISGQTITVIVRSDPIELNISLGESKRADVNSDNVYDLEVTFLSLNNGKAEISVKSISEAVPLNSLTGKSIMDKLDLDSDELTAYAIILILVLGTVLFIVIIFYLTRRRRRPMQQQQAAQQQMAKKDRSPRANKTNRSSKK